MKPLTILIVDDHPINLKLLRAQLEAEGHAVVEAANGAEALALMDRKSVDVIVSDILMPVMDGYRFCYEVRRSERFRELPLIIYTSSYVSPSDEKLSLDLGADKYLRKPAPVEEMVRAIDEALVSPHRQPSAPTDTADVLKEYSARLVTKLEEKNVELERVGAQLRDANAQLRELLQHSPAVLYALRVEGETIVPRLASENVSRLLGFQVAEALRPEWWSEHLHPEDRERAEASNFETLALGASRTEYRIRHKDGGYRWVEDSRRLVRDREGLPVELVGVWSDITERKRAQDELHESERQLREMLDNLELVAVMVERDARIAYCNDYFLRLTGWQREEVIGFNWFDRFVPPERVDDARKRLTVLLAGGQDLLHSTHEVLTRSGQRRLLQWNNSLMYSASGEVVGTASIAEDITDRVRLEKQLLRAQRLESIGTLAGGIAHDLNNILLPILMGVTLLKRFDPNEPSMKAIDNIERSVRRGSELVKQVLLFARGTETSRATVWLAEIVHEIEAIITSTFPKDITLDVIIAPNLGSVTGDVTQLTQVLLNLCVNARDAMPRGGTISISAANADITDHDAKVHGGARGGRYVVLEVSDTGEGMSKEIIDRIFDPFFTTKEVGKGTGLGLSTAQGIVSAHGGILSVMSEPGEGSTFTIHLPARAAQPAATAIPEETGPPQGHGELILVVDDDASVLSITKQTLELFGYEVLTAEDGAQAIGIFSHRSADIALVLTDMAMPIIDGAALIAALNRMVPNVPIIATTGNPSAASMSKITRTGVTHILTKPYTAEHLLRTIAEVLGEEGAR